MPKRKQTESVSKFDDDFDDEDVSSNDGLNGPPIQRNAANARERARMRVLSSAFFRLKTIIPWVPHDTKLSKLDTLRLARNYIAYLSATLDGQNADEISHNMPHPQKLTWPYIFQQMPELNQKTGASISPISSLHSDQWAANAKDYHDPCSNNNFHHLPSGISYRDYQ